MYKIPHQNMYLIFLALILAQQSLAEYPIVFQKTTDFLSVPRYAMAATNVGSLALFAGGTIDFEGPSDIVDIFNSETREWSTTKFNVPRTYTYAASVGDLALFASTVNGSNSVEIFDASSGQWSLYPLCTEFTRITAATSVSKYVLYWGEANNVTAVCRFDTTTRQWTIDEVSPPHQAPAATSVGKYALFAGGIFNFENFTSITSNAVSIFNSETLQWSTATLSQARYNMAATSAGNLAFFGGGLSASTSGTTYDTVDIFDSTTLTWSVDALSKPRFSLAATSVGPYAIFGGGNLRGTNSPEVEIYDPSTKLWTYATLAAGRYQLPATSAGRFAFFAGGMYGIQPDIVDIFEFPDMATPNNNAPGQPSQGVPVPVSSTSNSNTPVNAPVAAISDASRHCWMPVGFGALLWFLFL